jgi:hypothetical protein
LIGSLSNPSAKPILINQEVEDELADAVDLYLNQVASRWNLSTDPNERYESNFGLGFTRGLIDQEKYETLFRLADEAFESEFNRPGGAGRLTASSQVSPMRVQPIHKGELGGLDGTSCRSCHFSGGPDGAGSGSQLTLLRGDGDSLSSATLRDPPHVMGLGYLSLAAQTIQKAFKVQIKNATEYAQNTKTTRRFQLKAVGISFGWVKVDPHGKIDTSEVQGLSSDLKIRPFGWKGRHTHLADVVDEAFQVHHGLQSQSRLKTYTQPQQKKEIYLGAGSVYDPDQDGVQAELGDGHALTVASYLALLGIPTIKVPESTRLKIAWAQGKRHFKDLGCAACHVPFLRIPVHSLDLFQSNLSDSLTIDLKQGAQDPKPRQLDFSPNQYGQIFRGYPLFAFTDFKRHDMGANLAEPRAEILPDGSGSVPGSMWLTRPLWGLADTAPYLHDGRAQTVDEAILWHGGEAQSARHLYAVSTQKEQAELRVFLMSLSRPGVLLVE